jgi:hypothetical protein
MDTFVLPKFHLSTHSLICSLFKDLFSKVIEFGQGFKVSPAPAAMDINEGSDSD